MYVTNQNIEECKIKIEVAVNKLDKNLQKIGLEIEPTKTNMIVFINKKDRENRVRCNIKGKRIGNIRSARFLGLVIDLKLKFDRHLKEMKKRVSIATNILKCINRVSWAMEVNTALMIYKGFVRSVIEYGIFIYYPRD